MYGVKKIVDDPLNIYLSELLMFDKKKKSSVM